MAGLGITGWWHCGKPRMGQEARKQAGQAAAGHAAGRRPLPQRQQAPLPQSHARSTPRGRPGLQEASPGGGARGKGRLELTDSVAGRELRDWAIGHPSRAASPPRRRPAPRSKPVSAPASRRRGGGEWELASLAGPPAHAERRGTRVPAAQRGSRRRRGALAGRGGADSGASPDPSFLGAFLLAHWPSQCSTTTRCYQSDHSASPAERLAELHGVTNHGAPLTSGAPGQSSTPPSCPAAIQKSSSSAAARQGQQQQGCSV